jgi:hypothetical protein
MGHADTGACTGTIIAAATTASTSSTSRTSKNMVILDVKHFNLWNISKGESFSFCTRHKATGDISQSPCMTPPKPCHIVKQGDRVFQLFILLLNFFAKHGSKSFNDSSFLKNSLSKWLSPFLTLGQCCATAIVVLMLNKKSPLH